MKIEKLSDNQIRCTLTRADLAIRELKLSEIAYGTEKAKSLFRDMMKQAATEFGFDTEDIPLMIEAIPSSAGSVVLIITKVEDPEELDTRFSKFAPLNEAIKKAEVAMEKLDGAEENTLKVRSFSFATIDGVINASNLLDEVYHGMNTLYKDNINEFYILALSQTDHTTLEFNRICNMLSEYGSLEKSTGITLAYLEEHCEVVISANAIQQLNTI
ncbi:MAG: adaptor protein MecA [Eubacteriales bacterium]